MRYAPGSQENRKPGKQELRKSGNAPSARRDDTRGNWRQAFDISALPHCRIAPFDARHSTFNVRHSAFGVPEFLFS